MGLTDIELKRGVRQRECSGQQRFNVACGKGTDRRSVTPVASAADAIERQRSQVSRYGLN